MQKRIIWTDSSNSVRIVAIDHEPQNDEDVGHTSIHVEAYKGWQRQEIGVLNQAYLTEEPLRELLVQCGLLPAE